MTFLTGIDHPAGTDHPIMGQHPQGERFDVQHACPSCPSPLTGGLVVMPNPLCPWCAGTGLVSGDELDRWSAAALRQGTQTPTRD